MNPALLAALEDFHDFEPKEEDFLTAVTEGLSSRPKSLPAKFFYDPEGSKLFERICVLPEYYPTRTEIGILENNSAEIARAVGGSRHVLEFGSGSSTKIRILLEALLSPLSYVPMDISRLHLIESAAGLARAFPDIPVIAICTDYSAPFAFPELPAGRRLGFFPGSSIGNFHRHEAVEFLNNARTLLEGGGMLVGADLIKEEAVLNAAYNDAQGVTAAFNKNLLARCNRELGTDIDAFDHRAFYNADAERIEMHLVANREQRIDVGGRTFLFRPDQSIHTENSYKYSIDGFRALAGDAGFTARKVWTDADNLFSIHYLEAD